jgi:hypothetical protein
MAQLPQAELQKYRADGDVISNFQLATTKFDAHSPGFARHHGNESS